MYTYIETICIYSVNNVDLSEKKYISRVNLLIKKLLGIYIYSVAIRFHPPHRTELIPK